MTLSINTNESEGSNGEKLPQRDWFLLPLLSLLTIFLLVVSTELIARRTFARSKPPLDACMGPIDPITGIRLPRPDTVCWGKAPESEWVEYRLNHCGHRAGMECRPKTPGTYRIVMIGSSVALGSPIQREKTIAAILPIDLSHYTGRHIELYNEGMDGAFPHRIAQYFDEVLAAQPDMILWILTPFDISTETSDRFMPIPGEKKGTVARAWFRLKETFIERSFSQAVNYISERGLKLFEDSSAGTMLQHFVFKSESQYVRSCLFGRDSIMGYLRVRESTEWQSYLRLFDNDDATIEGRARDAGVSLVAVLVPSRPQAALLSMGEWPAGYDPYKLNTQLRSIIVSHGGTYIDIFSDYRNISSPEQYYFVVNGHPTADGDAIIADMLAKKLISGAIPALRTAAQPQAGLEK